MVTIRLARHGAHKRPFYRIVVADSRKRRDGSIIEQVGTYDATKDPSAVSIDLEKVDTWVAKGAQMSDRVAKIVAAERGEELPAKIAKRAAMKAAEKEAAAKAAAEAAAKKAAEAAEAEEE